MGGREERRKAGFVCLKAFNERWYVPQYIQRIHKNHRYNSKNISPRLPPKTAVLCVRQARTT